MVWGEGEEGGGVQTKARHVKKRILDKSCMCVVITQLCNHTGFVELEGMVTKHDRITSRSDNKNKQDKRASERERRINKNGW